MLVKVKDAMISNMFLIAFHVWLCFSKLEAGVDLFKACEVSYSCGELVNISYPFWGNERQGICGMRGLELKCNDDRRTTIEINSFEYYVLNISQWDPNRVSMRIARSDLFDDLCPKNINKIQTATLDYGEFVYTANDRDISIWYDCPAEEGIPEEFRFWCNSTGRLMNYALEAEAMYFSRNLSGCKNNINATVTMKGWEEGRGNNRTTLLETALRQGFEVEPFLYGCEQCKESGGMCGGNAAKSGGMWEGNATEYFGNATCICRNGDIRPSHCTAVTPPPASVSHTMTGQPNHMRKKAIIGASASGSIILIISIIIISIYYQRKSISNKDTIEKIIRRYSTQTPKRYSYSKIKKITTSFKNKIGRGGFSTVYRGKLPDGRDVAVKLLNESKDENGQDFMNEVVSITQTSHVNIATLLGFCYEGNKRALIYEYMPKGSLDKYMMRNDDDVGELDWNTLYNIVIGVARGLEYLHRGCNTRILHFDIKPHNILLDNEFCPKISDFGLAKQCKAKETHVSMTGMKGTVGFMAPEVIFRSYGKVSYKSDVYSYGMLVLEMVGERKNPNEEASSEEYFPDWIYKDLTQCETNGGCCCWGNTEVEEEKARKMIIVGLHCIQTLPHERPSMSDVVAMLEGSVDVLQIPPKPNLFGPLTLEMPQLPSSFSSSSSTSY